MQKLFSVIEHHSYFAVRHNPSGEQAAMGDGVDHGFQDQNGNTLYPGMDGFIEAWEKSLNECPSEVLEAYFPHLIEA